MDIACTAVRVPTLRAHAESITIETYLDITPGEARELLSKAPGVEVRDDVENNVYPMPLTATAKYDVEVGRIRQSLVFGKKGLELFVCGDQLLRGAASNAVLIAEAILFPEKFPRHGTYEAIHPPTFLLVHSIIVSLTHLPPYPLTQPPTHLPLSRRLSLPAQEAADGLGQHRALYGCGHVCLFGCQLLLQVRRRRRRRRRRESSVQRRGEE